MSPDTRLILTALLSALTSSGFMSLVLYFVQRRDRRIDKREADNSAQSRMLIGLGHDRMILLTDRFVRRGCITLKEKRNLEYLYTPYRDMGGNGDCKIGYDACQSLPVVSEEAAEQAEIELRRREFYYEVEQ